MKNNVILFLLFFSIVSTSWSQQVSVADATTVAKNMIQNSKMGYYDGLCQIDTIETFCYKNHILIYDVLFQSGVRVLVSGNKAVEPVLGVYTTKGGSILNRSDENVLGIKSIVNEYAEQISSSFDSLPFSDDYSEKWERLLNANYSSSYVVEPLIRSKWTQDYSNDTLACNAYNYFSPHSGGYCGCDSDVDNYPVGCVAVAMGQIMYYWKHPIWLPNQVNQFDWCNMSDSLIVNDAFYEIKRNSVAFLLKSCADSLHMTYYDCNSVSNINKVPEVMSRCFAYKDSVRYRRKIGYSDADWKRMIKENLDAERPIIYRGESPNGGVGHTFICDGYTTDDLFHFNFGEIGIMDGVFRLDSIAPSSFNFTSSQAAVFNIYPENRQDYCDFSIPLEFHYYNYYTLQGNTSPAPYLNVPRTFTVLESVSDITTYSEAWRVIPEGETVEYVAHKEVVLRPGFTAEAGCDFVAKVEPCLKCEESVENERNLRYAALGYVSVSQFNNDATRSMVADNATEDVVEKENKEEDEMKNLSGMVYPNPNDGSFTIHLPFDGNETYVVEIINTEGKRVYHKDNVVLNEIFINTNLQQGLYFLKAYSKQRSFVNKIIVNR